ncbi:carbohydrate kinase family protein [Thermodesulfatator atlanticus]|uniref:carbohydrate kinase family protein n=1 Tax=Thermodesulfatator atlanticus TaxID=501497 RepID=UPI0003B6E345|nr:PfkB family carbohydrate kinase [Thermodesulfatator atlanticus]
MRIVGSGALNLDFFYEIDDLRRLKKIGKDLKPGGEVWGTREEFEKLRDELEQKGKFIARSGGGSAANTIYALKNWGFETGFIGIVGEDPEGDAILAELAGVELSRVIRKGKSACCIIIIDAQKDRAIFVSPHSEEHLLAHYQPSTIPQEWLHVSSLITNEGLAFHRNLKEKHQGTFSIDPGEIYAQKGLEFLKPLLSRAEFLFITEQELVYLGLKPEDFADLSSNVFLKRGKKGAILFKDGQKIEIPAVKPQEILDNTGAGDVFDAGVIAGVLSGLSAREAGFLGAAMAALSLRDYGRKGYPKREEFLYWRNHGAGKS